MKNDNGNDRSLNNVHLSLKRDYSKLISLGIKNKNFKAVMKDDNSEIRNLVATSCIPFAITFGGTVVGVLTLGTAFAFSLFNPRLGTESRVFCDIVNASSATIKNMGALSITSLTLPVVMSTLTKKSIINKTEKYKNGKYYTKDSIKKIDEKEATLRFVNDLIKDKDDKTLSFAKDFLSNVDISNNQKRYNKKLFEYMASYRESLKVGTTVEEVANQLEKMKELKTFIRESKESDGASLEFLDSDYIKEFIKDKKNKRKNKTIKRRN